MISTKKILSLNSSLFAFAQIFDFQSRTNPNAQESGPKVSNPFKKIDFEKILKKIKNTLSPKILIISAAVVVVVLGAWYFTKNSKADSETVSLSPTASGNLNKQVAFPIRDKDGKDTGNKLTVTFTSLERTDKILYSGKPLSAKPGKDFVVSNIEIENTTKDRLTVRPVDFIRLDAGGKNYAPDIQINALKVEPLSVKKTRTIFIVNEEPKTLKFLIGEISGNRETVEVTL